MGEGRRLKELLDYNNITVKELANETKIKPTTLYSIIQRDANVKESYIRSIANYLCISRTRLKVFLSTDSIPAKNIRGFKIETEPIVVNIDEKPTFKTLDSILDDDVQEYKDDIQQLLDKVSKYLSEAVFNNLEKSKIPLLDNFLKLNRVGKIEAEKRVEELTHIEKYTKRDEPIINAAHKRTDIDIPEDADKFDDDIMDDDDF